jgi:hypothetical protein
MRTQSIVRARLVGSALCLGLALAACGGGGKSKDGGIVSGLGGSGSGGEGGGTIPFDGENAPYGENTTTTRLQSVVTVMNDLLGNKTRSQDTAVVGPKLIGGIIYDRLATVRSDDPTRGGEYWIKNNPDGTLDFAGFLHTDLLSGVLPGASTTFDAPIKVNLNAPVGVPQQVTATGSVALDGTSAPSRATFTGQYALAEKNTTVPTGLGPLAGCNHYSGAATTDSAEVPALLQGMTVAAELWHHPSYGVVAFNAPTLGVGTAMTGSYDCGSVDASGYRIIRKVGLVDATTSFNLDSYECDGQALAADKNTHAKMLLELRWVDETAAKTSVQPMPGLVEFATRWGYFPNTIYPLPASVFHPEENEKGFVYWYSYVDQAAKNESGASTSYHIKVGSAPGLSPVRVTARIYYKTIPALVGPGPDAAALGSGNKDGGKDAGLADGSRDVPGTIGDVPRDSGRPDLGPAGATCNLIVNGNAEAAPGSTDGNPVPTPGWTVTGQATAGEYGAPFGYAGPADPGPDDRGKNLFSGGASDGTSTLTQTVNLSQYGTAIDAGGVSYSLSGWLGGWDGQDDNAVLTATFQGTSGTALGTGTIGPVLSTERGGVSGLLFRSTSGAVPAGTRTVLVVVTFNRTSGTANDGYADSLSLALSGAGIPAGTCSVGPVGDGGAGTDGGRDVPAGTGGMGGTGGAGGSGGITGTGGGLVTVPPGTPTIIEEFDTLPTATTQFVPIQAAGGDFAKFATASGGRLVVDVPANNSWGKTGVRSKDPVFEVTDDMAQNPWSVLVELEPTASTGFVVALSPAAADDIWGYGNFWLAWVRHPVAGGTSANIANTQNTADTSKVLTNTPLTAPGTVAVVARPGQVQACTSSGWGMEGSYAWMKTGTKVYAYVFAHPYDANMPVKLAVKSVKVIRGAACGAAGAIPAYTAAPEKAVFGDDLSAGTAAYWTPIQAAGGDYAKFATTPAGELVVNVPANNTWGKTGVRSSYYMFDVRDDMDATPLSLSFDFVPSRTSGFVIALSPAAADDIWGYGNVWAALVRHPTGGGTSANLANTQDATDSNVSLTNVPLTAPTTVTLAVRPGHVQMCTSTGWAMEGDYKWLKTGTKVYAYVFAHPYDANMPVQMDLTAVRAERVSACGAAGAIPPYTAVPEKAVFADDLSAGAAPNWTPIQAAGGDYAKFATMSGGDLYVNVPANNSWGKTGLRSSYFMFDVRDDMATTPLSLAFDFVPSRTSGFVLALSPAAADDIWGYGNFWAAFVRHPTGSGAAANIANTQNATDSAKSLPNIPSEAPTTATLSVRPGHVQMCTSTGWGMEGDYAWLTKGTKVYAYAFAHPYDANMPVQMDLTSVRADRTAACGASGAVPAYPAPAPRVLFTDAFAGGYAQNWVGIGAAGGNFTSFAVTTTNEVYINVPKDNSWGKTGIRSNYYLFDVRSDYATSPLTLDFAIDPARTSGFVIALSPAAADDIWGYGNVWMDFIIDPDTGLAQFELANTQNTTDTSISKTGLSAAIPSKVSLAITPKHVKATLSNGQVLEGDYAWLVEGTKVYAYAFSHPVRANLPSSLALKSVTATR